jgi:hypothetical protein
MLAKDKNMKKIPLIILSVSLITNLCFAYGKAASNSIGVSLIELIANPEKYHGKLIRVIGVTQIEFEGNQIFTSKEHYEFSVLKNALKINPDIEVLGVKEDKLKKYNGKYVLIEGIFNKDDTGHMGMNSGSIDKVSRFQLWDRQTK